MAAFGVAAHGVALCGGNQLSLLVLALACFRDLLSVVFGALLNIVPS